MTVYLVGAGPGAADLITVRAARLLARADVVIHDRLVADEILDLAPERCRRIDVGKSAGHAPTPQSRINDLLVEHGRAAETVIRLKGGDPYVFGRGGEEAVALLAAGIAFDVVPGITSATAVPAAAGVPVTMRDHSSAFTVITGHGDPDDSGVDWGAHAATDATLVIVMAAATIGDVAKRLIVGGRDPETPVTAIHRGTTQGQHEVRTTLAEIGHHELVAPCTIVVGDVAALDLRSPHH